jgi:hypothetical protein
MLSLPDQPARRGLASCTTCHTVQRVLDSTHTADEFAALIPRMMRYGAMSRPHRPQTPPDRQATSAPRGDVLVRMAEYFASVNRSGGRPQNYTLKTAPRPIAINEMRASDPVEIVAPSPDIYRIAARASETLPRARSISNSMPTTTPGLP